MLKPRLLNTVAQRWLLAVAILVCVLMSRTHGAGSSCDARGLAVQRDGKLVVVAHSRPGTGDTIVVARYSARGIPDRRFGNNGRAYVAVGQAVTHAAAAIDYRQRILVFVRHESAGDYTLLRLLPSGQLDGTFGSSGRTVGSVQSDVADFSVDSKGRIVVAGTSAASGTADVAVVRHLEDGRMDPAFGSVNVDLGGDAAARSVRIDRAQRIVVAASASGDVAVVRLTDAGVLDTTFGIGGVRVLLRAGNEPVFSLALTRDNGAVVSAYNATSGQSWLLVRLDRSGNLDAGFAGTGVYDVPGSAPGDPDALVVDSKRRVLVSGYAQGRAAVARVTRRGTLDTTFGGSGLVLFPDPPPSDGIETWYALALSRRGRIALVGTRESPGGRTALVAVLRPDGTPDYRFGNQGLIAETF